MFQTYVPPAFYDQQVRIRDPRLQRPPFVSAFGVASSDNTLAYVGVALGGALLLSVVYAAWKTTE